MTKHRRTTETPEGRGLLRMAGSRAIKVRYQLVVMQTDDDQVDTGELVGPFDVRGMVEVNIIEGGER